MPNGHFTTTTQRGFPTMALKATAQRFGTTRRQRNQQRTPSQMHAYVVRTYGVSAGCAWQRAYSEGGLTAAANALRAYRYQH